MYITAKHKDAKKAKVYDNMGKPVPCVLSYNTKTKMATLALLSSDKYGKLKLVTRSKGKRSGEIVTVCVELLGSWLEIKGKRVD